jgi:hypothetical protein
VFIGSVVVQPLRNRKSYSLVGKARSPVIYGGIVKGSRVAFGIGKDNFKVVKVLFG